MNVRESLLIINKENVQDNIVDKHCEFVALLRERIVRVKGNTKNHLVEEIL